MFYLVAMWAIEEAGHKVTPTDIPGLYDVEGIGSDLTLNQLVSITKERGFRWNPPLVLPFKLDQSS